MTKSTKPKTASEIPSAILQRLLKVQGFVFDMDGTLVLASRSHRGHAALPGALEVTSRLTRRGIPFVVYTNGTAMTPNQCANQLHQAGFRIPVENMLTPSTSAAYLFRSRGYRKIMVFGGDGVRQPLEQAGLEIVSPGGRVDVDAVFAGWDRDFTMDHLDSACHAIWNGAAMFSASQTRFFATADGKGLSTSRAIAAVMKDMTGCRVNTIGKPSMWALRNAGRQLGVAPKNMAVVGDDPELEIAMAHRGGSLAIAVRTGLAFAECLDQLPETRRPHIDLGNVGELLQFI